MRLIDADALLSDIERTIEESGCVNHAAGGVKMQENVCKKYGITPEELKEGVDIVSKNLGKICDTRVLFAVAELLVNGDIKGGE